MGNIFSLDDMRDFLPLPCIPGEPLRWHASVSGLFDLENAPESDDWDDIDVYPVVQYVANADSDGQYTITYDTKTGFFDVLRTSGNGGSSLGEGIPTLREAKQIAELYRLINP